MTPLVDTHLHLYRTKREGRGAKDLYEIWEYGAGASPVFAEWEGDLIHATSAMELAGVDFAIVANLLDAPLYDYPAGELLRINQWAVSVADDDPRFLVCLGVDPRFFSTADIVGQIENLGRRRSVVGIKIHPPMQEFDVQDKQLWPMFAACDRLGLSVVAHSGPSRDGPHLGEPDAFRPLLDAFPSLRVVLAHLGGAAWSQIPALAEDYPHLCFDLSEIIHWLGATRAPTADELVQLLRDVGTDRVMLGSDFPWYDIGRSADIVRRLPGLTAEDIAQINGANAARVFGIGG